MDNLKFDDQSTRDAVQDEMHFYFANGGRTVLELTTFGRDLEYLKQVSKQSKVNIVAGAGFYVNYGLPSSTLKLTVEQIYDHMTKELTGPAPCGIIGEIGSGVPIHEFERKCLLAAGQLSEQYPTLPVNIHPGREKSMPYETLRQFMESGGRKENLIMSHLDRTLMDKESLLEFAKQGCVCELDLFGIETTHYELKDDLNFIGDATRIDCLRWLIDDGHLENIVISQDIHTKHRLVKFSFSCLFLEILNHTFSFFGLQMKFGGHGYSHILMNVGFNFVFI